ncbi:MAG: site-2 protease family protein [Candidatus Paceibacterota bacterium]|jgi:Zn-dependent protease
METTVIFSIVILVMSVVLHEVSHGFAAYLLGDPTAKIAGRLTLNPLKHLDWMGSVIVPLILSLFPGGFIIGWAKPVPYNPHMLRGGKYGPAMVAGAGPAMNLAIAVFFAFLIRSSLAMSLGGSTMVVLSGTIVLTNVALAIFNLTPVSPFDGSKILFAFLPRAWRGVETFLESNQLIVILVVILGMGYILSPVTSAIVHLLLW